MGIDPREQRAIFHKFVRGNAAKNASDAQPMALWPTKGDEHAYKDGFEVCRELRQMGLPTPIVMLTAKSDEFDKVMGLDLGADDYVTKPFHILSLRKKIEEEPSAPAT